MTVAEMKALLTLMERDTRFHVHYETQEAMDEAADLERAADELDARAQASADADDLADPEQT